VFAHLTGSARVAAERIVAHLDGRGNRLGRDRLKTNTAA